MSKEPLNFDDLDLDIIDPTPNPTPAPDPEPTPTPTPEPEPKKKPGRKKVDVEIIDDDPEPEPAPTPTPEPKVPEKTEDEESLFDVIAKQLGYEFDEQEVYDETEEGLTNFVQNVSDKIADQKLNEFLSSLPPVATEFFDYLTMLGEEANEDNIKKFFSAASPEIDYKSVDISDVDVQKSVLKTLYRKMEYSDEEIKELIEDDEIAGVLKKRAEAGVKKLEVFQERERKALIEQQKAKDEQRKKEVNEFWQSVDQTIKKGKVQNLAIPPAEQKQLLDYMSKPTKSGRSAMQDELANLSVEDRVALAVWLKNKGNLDKYVQQAARTQRATSLREKLATKTTRLKSGVGNDTSDFGDIVLE